MLSILIQIWNISCDSILEILGEKRDIADDWQQIGNSLNNCSSSS